MEGRGEREVMSKERRRKREREREGMELSNMIHHHSDSHMVLSARSRN